MKQNKSQYFWLFGANLFISTFTFGGGYVVVPMVRRYFVERKQYFSEEDLMEMSAIAQSSPGAIAINLSALAGYRVAGVIGVMISCIASIIPPLFILGVISAFYTMFISNHLISAILKGMQAGVAALIVDLVVDMCSIIIKEKSLFLTLLIPTAFIANFIMEVNVAVILLVTCLLCMIRVFLKKGRN